MQKFFKNKKVLITGHTGFKGSWLSQILINWGAEVSGISLRPDTNPNLFSILDLEKKTGTYFSDIRDFEKIKGIFKKEKPEIVFHLAAQPIVRDSYDDPLKTYSTNVMGTANVIQAIKEVECVKSAIIITTDKVYENKEQEYSYKETDAMGGYDPYSASKAAADIVSQSYIRSFFNPDKYPQNHGTLIAIARAGNVIGGGDWGNHRLVPDILRYIYEKERPIIIRNPQSIRPWQHVLEPLSGYLQLAMNLYLGEKNLSTTWNFGPDDKSSVPVLELVKKSIEILNKGSIDIQKDSEKHEAGILKLDTTKARDLLKWKPKMKLEETLVLTFEWYKKFYEKTDDMQEFTINQIDSFFNCIWKRN